MAKQYKEYAAAWYRRNAERMKLKSKARYLLNKEKRKAQAAAWYKANKERRAITAIEWQRKNQDKFKGLIRDWISRNKERMKELRRNNHIKNHLKRCSESASRRAISKKATPSWANEFFIEEIYDLAKRRTALRSGGHKWHVDHIVPLNSDLVCGLHVHNNLRVIPAEENIRKHNRQWPDMS